jgi:N-acetyl-beta-hexosaminidase
MLKRAALFLAIFFLLSAGGCGTIPDRGPSPGPAAPQSGIMLDCARRYYSPEALKQYVDLLSGRSGGFLQLHLTDNENVGVECVLLGQTAETAVRSADGAYQNAQTGGRFLTRAQIADLLAYAKQRDVEIVPEIDGPAHMDGFFTLAALCGGQTYADGLQADGADDGELDLSSAQALDFVKRLYTEYAALFQGCRYFHIGCDELFSAAEAQETAYIGAVSQLLASQGFTVRMWNDLLTTSDIGRISPSIQITYWSYDGDTEDDSERAARRAVRASVPELQALGFQVLVYNSYYLYYVPSDETNNAQDRAEMVNDLLENWDLAVWDGQTGAKLNSRSNILEACVSVWGEDSGNCSAADIYTQTKALYEAMLLKAGQ